MLKIEEDGKRWLRRPKLYKGVVEPYKKKKFSVLRSIVPAAGVAHQAVT